MTEFFFEYTKMLPLNFRFGGKMCDAAIENFGVDVKVRVFIVMSHTNERAIDGSHVQRAMHSAGMFWIRVLTFFVVVVVLNI